MWRSLSKDSDTFSPLFYSVSIVRQIFLSKYSHPIFSIISFPYYSHLVRWQILHTHMENQPVERHTIFEICTVAHFQKKEGLTFVYLILFSLAVYVYLFCFTNIVYCCSFLSWTLPYYPIYVRLVLLHVPVKTLLQFWRLRWLILWDPSFVGFSLVFISIHDQLGPHAVDLSPHGTSSWPPWPMLALLFDFFLVRPKLFLSGDYSRHNHSISPIKHELGHDLPHRAQPCLFWPKEWP